MRAFPSSFAYLLSLSLFIYFMIITYHAQYSLTPPVDNAIGKSPFLPSFQFSILITTRSSCTLPCTVLGSLQLWDVSCVVLFIVAHRLFRNYILLSSLCRRVNQAHFIDKFSCPRDVSSHTPHTARYNVYKLFMENDPLCVVSWIYRSIGAHCFEYINLLLFIVCLTTRRNI